jgi:hypothetical protein
MAIVNIHLLSRLISHQDKPPVGEAINDHEVGGIDRLGYKYYAQALVTILKKTDAKMPICIGLYGRCSILLRNNNLKI